MDYTVFQQDEVHTVENTLGAKGLALQRIALGAWLVWLDSANLDRSFIERMPDLLAQYAAANPYPIVRWLLHFGASPHANEIGTFLPVIQLLIASALCLGFLTRFCSITGLVFTGCFFLIAGHLGLDITAWTFLLGLSFTTLALADAGRYYGLDYYLFKPSATTEKPFKFKDKKHKDIVNSLNKQLKKNASKSSKKGGKKSKATSDS